MQLNPPRPPRVSKRLGSATLNTGSLLAMDRELGPAIFHAQLVEALKTVGHRRRRGKLGVARSYPKGQRLRRVQSMSSRPQRRE